MAYNSKNQLLRIVDIQNIVIQHAREHGSTQEWIFNKIIFPTYRISRATFYKYLSINAKKELKSIKEAESFA